MSGHYLQPTWRRKPSLMMEVVQEIEGQSSNFFMIFFFFLEEADQFFSEKFPPLRLMDANVSSVIGSVPQIQINGCCFTGVILSYVKTAVCLYVCVCVCTCLGNINEKEFRHTLRSHNTVCLVLLYTFTH